MNCPLPAYSFHGALAVYTAGGLFWAFLPYFIGLQTEQGGLNQTQAGSLGSGYLLGFTLASVTALWWAPRLDCRITIIAAALITGIMLYILQGTQAYVPSLASVIIIGIMMGGLWSIAYRIFAETPNPDRSFALGIVISYTILALISYIIGRYVAPGGGLSGAALLLGLVILTLALGALLLPARLAPNPTENKVPAAISYRPSAAMIMALLGILTTGFAFAAIWAFAERIGINAGLGREAISPVIASNLLASAAGSALASALGAKLGRRPCLFTGLAVMAGATLVLPLAETFQLYAAAIAGLGFGVGFVLPYQMATLAVLDKARRYVALIAAAQGLGSAAGPWLGGLAADLGGIGGLVAIALCMLALSAMAFLVIRQA